MYAYRRLGHASSHVHVSLGLPQARQSFSHMLVSLWLPQASQSFYPSACLTCISSFYLPSVVLTPSLKCETDCCHCNGAVNVHVAIQGAKDHTLLSMDTLLATPLGSPQDPLPTRRVDIDLTPVSLVLGNPMMCYPNSPPEFQLLNGNSRRARGTTVGASGQNFKGDVVAAVQPNIQAELQDAKVSATSFRLCFVNTTQNLF